MSAPHRPGSPPPEGATESDALPRLASAPLHARGFLANASNHTLLVEVAGGDVPIHAVYKPASGERPLWDFPPGSLCRREVAAWEVDRFLGWGLVPPTVLRDGPMGPGSVQLFVPHDPEQHYFVLVADPTHHVDLARMAVFDLLCNNADRKASHVMLADGGRIVGCDHGLTFHPEMKLRTVIWELGGKPVEPRWRADCTRLAEAVADPSHGLTRRLEELLSLPEIETLGLRAGALAETTALPRVEERRRPYPWPPL